MKKNSIDYPHFNKSCVMLKNYYINNAVAVSPHSRVQQVMIVMLLFFSRG
jgi:hypothetical protein